MLYEIDMTMLFYRILANNSIRTIPRFAFSRYTVLEIM